MRVVNNKITIGRGETSDYTLNVKYYQDGNPYTLKGSSDVDFIAVFTVKENTNSTTTSTAPIIIELRTNGNGDYPVFEEEFIYNDTLKHLDLSDDANKALATEDRLGQIFIDSEKTANDTVIHKYYYVINSQDGYSWKELKPFVLKFKLSYDVTSILEPKRYVYDVNILWGNWKEGEHVLDNFNIAGKQILISPTDFIVEASLSG